MNALAPSFIPRRDRDWYNHLDPELDYSGKFAANVQQIQASDYELGCDILLCRKGKELGFISYDDGMSFTIGGGADMPHFKLRLTLSFNIELTAIWTAWGTKGNDLPRKTNHGAQESYNFSNRLHNVTVASIYPNEPYAGLRGEALGTPGWRICWHHQKPPYCFNFQISPWRYIQLTDRQRKAVKAFWRLGQNDVKVRVVTRGQGLLLPCWKLMTTMPVPTPHPFPFHDWNSKDKKEWSRHMARVVSLKQNATLQDHYMILDEPPGNEPCIGEMQDGPPLVFINETQYETVKLVGLRREMESLSAVVERRSRCQMYTFRLEAVDLLHTSWESHPERLYYCMIDMALQCGVQPTSDLELPSPPLGSFAQIVFSAALGDSHSTVESHTLPGFVVRPPAQYHNLYMVNPVCLMVYASLSFDHQQFSGRVELVPPTFAYEEAAVSMKDVLYRQRSGCVLKELLLARDSYHIQFDTRRGVVDSEAVAYGLRLLEEKIIDERQRQALLDVFTTGQTDHQRFRSLFSLVSGGPGTGKTRVSAHVTKFCLLRKKSILVVGPSHNCLDVLEDEIIVQLNGNDQLTKHEVYRLDLELGEAYEWRMKKGKEGRKAEENTSSKTFLDTKELHKLYQDIKSIDTWDIFLPLWNWVESRTSSNSLFSMGRYINRRLQEYCAATPRWRRYHDKDPENALISDVLVWYIAFTREIGAFVQLPSVALNEYQIELVNGFEVAMAQLMRFYVTKAKAVFCPVMAGANDVLREYQPQHILVEDASFITETLCLNVIRHHDCAAEKIVLTGDTLQSPILLTSWSRNECYSSESMSLIERFQKTGVSCSILERQYRMKPEVHAFISENFYGATITTKHVHRPSTSNLIDQLRPPVISLAGNVMFLAVQDSSIWSDEKTGSIFNPQYVSCIKLLVQELVHDGVKPEDILIISNYAGERLVLHTLLSITPGVTSKGVEKIEIQNAMAVQGQAKRFVIVSTTRPGGYLGLGSVAHEKLQCLAMSRARDSLIIVGDPNLAEYQRIWEHPSLPSDFWARIINWCKRNSRILPFKADCRALNRELGIPNTAQHTRKDTSVVESPKRAFMRDGHRRLLCHERSGPRGCPTSYGYASFVHNRMG